MNRFDQTLAAAQQALQQGNYSRALELAESVRASAPANALAAVLALQVNAALAAGEPERALEPITALRALPQAAPALTRTHAVVLNRCAAAARRRGELAKAYALFADALAIDPGFDDARFNLAHLACELGDDERAAAECERLLQTQPQDAEVWLIRARLAERGGPPTFASEALATLDAAARVNLARDLADLGAPALSAPLLDGPLDAAVLRLPSLVGKLAQAGAAELAATTAQRFAGAARKSVVGLRLALEGALGLPAVPGSSAELAAARARFDIGLDTLDEQWPDAALRALPKSLEHLAYAPFFLAYHGCDERARMARYGALIERAAQALGYPRLARTPPRRKPRVLLLSSFWRRSTIGAYFGAWIAPLRAAGFETIVAQLGPEHDDVTQALGRAADRYRLLSGSVDQSLAELRGLNADLAIYPEIGMDGRIAALAAVGVAARQLCAFGHPITTGLARIDGYLSAAAIEPENACEHYCEPLLQLPGLAARFAEPPPPAPLTRAELGLPVDARLVLCPQSSFKLHPDFDATLAQIAGRDPRAVVVLFEGQRLALTTALKQRLERAYSQYGADPQRQLHWLQPMPREHYLAVNQACDVMVDTVGFSGGNTAYDALSVGLPIVAVEGALMRGRQSAAMLRLLELPELIVGADQQAERAVEIAQNQELRQSLSRRIIAARQRLFEACDDQALIDLVRTVLAVA